MILLGSGVALTLGHAGATSPAEPCLGGGSAVDEDGTVHCVSIRYHGKPVTAKKLAELSKRKPFYSLQILLQTTIFDTKAEYDAAATEAIADFCAKDPRRADRPPCQ